MSQRPPLLLPRSQHHHDSTSSTATSESDEPVYAPPLRKASFSATRHQQALQQPAAESPMRRSSSPESWGSDDELSGANASALGITGINGTLTNGYPRRGTITTGAPFSRPASTVTSPPSRPATAFPRQRRHSKRSNTIPPSSPVGASTPSRKETGRKRAAEASAHSFDERRELKGKGKERKEDDSSPAATPAATSTPVFDALDPLSAFAFTPGASSPNGRPLRRPTIKPSRPRTPPLPASLPFPPAAPSASSSSIFTASRHTANHSHPPRKPEKPPEPEASQSLQELLQTVDLSAALKLVQTIQHSQANPAPPITASPSTTSIAPSASASTPFTSSLHTASTTPLLLNFAATPLNGVHSSTDPALTPDRDRRKSLTIGLKRVRAPSTASVAGSAHRRMPDDHITSNGLVRSFDEQISRVHLNLSPATIRRAQNCSNYITSRYHNPVNLLSVARWRQSSGGADGRSDTGWGKRRNHDPVSWEIYPDDVEIYVKEEMARQAREQAVSSLQQSNGSGYLSSETRSLESHAGLGNSSQSVVPASPHGRFGFSQSSLNGIKPNGFSPNGSVSALVSPSGPFSATSSYNTPSSHQSRHSASQSLTLLDSPSLILSAVQSRDNNSLDSEPRSGLRRSTSLASAPKNGLGGSASLQRIFRQSLGAGTSQEQVNEPVARSGFSRRFDRIRGRTNDNGVDSNLSERGGTTDVGSDGGEILMRSSLGSHGRRVAVADGYKSSGGEEGRRTVRGGLWGKVRHGMKRGPMDSQVEIGLDETMLSATQDSAVDRASSRPRRVWIESDDEDEKPPRQILDLNDDDFAAIGGSLRQIRVQANRVDMVLPKVPVALATYLDDIAEQEKHVKHQFGITVQYTYPRLPAQVVAQLASVKKEQAGHMSFLASDYLTSSDESDTEPSDTDGERDALDLAVDRRTSSRFRRRSRSPDHSHLAMHSRHPTEPTSRPSPLMRSRSHTLGGALRPTEKIVPHPKREPLQVAERALEELNRAISELDHATVMYTDEQTRVEREIHSLMGAVDDVQRDINSTHAQQLQHTQDHYTRLRTCLERPSPTLDHLWALLAQILQMVLYLARALVFLFRMVRYLISIPVVTFRWFFFLR